MEEHLHPNVYSNAVMHPCDDVIEKGPYYQIWINNSNIYFIKSVYGGGIGNY